MDAKLTHASLFSGIGGFDLAAEWADGLMPSTARLTRFAVILFNIIFQIQFNMEILKQQTLPFGEEKSTSLPEDFRARMQVSPKGMEEVSRESTEAEPDWSLKCFEQSVRLCQSSLFQKMLPTCYEQTEDETSCLSSINWPQWGIFQNGELQVRQRSVPRTGGRGFTWFLTPTASDYLRANLSSPMYSRRLERSAGCLPEQLSRLGFRGKMNYQFALMIMGFPPDWLELEPKK